MTFPKLIPCMSEALAAKGTASGTRYIIRFRTRKDFVSCLRAIRSEPADSPLRTDVRPLHMIRGLACVLQSFEKLTQFPQISSIERDIKTASVHARLRHAASVPAEEAGSAPIVPWGVEHIRAPDAWRRAAARSRVKIAVIDTGIDYNHPDLRDCIAGGVNLVYRHMLPLDDNGHGTHIAGTIAAQTERDGILGVAPGASIYAVKAFDYNGTAFVSDIVYGIEWCVRNQIDIINMSFGMKTRSQSLEDAVRRAHRAGTVIVASSGNDGRTGIDYPARFPQVISVGATGRNKAVAPFSNKSRHIDIYAPGEKIYSTWLRGRYYELSGTSMATSHVSGVIALMLAARPHLRPADIKTALQRNSSKLKTASARLSQTGEVDALRTLKNLPH